VRSHPDSQAAADAQLRALFAGAWS
jgi:hypothetical protein